MHSLGSASTVVLSIVYNLQIGFPVVTILWGNNLNNSFHLGLMLNYVQ